jgi:hypothetical protein
MNYTNILPGGADLFHADGQEDMTLILAFRYFASGPKSTTQ